MTKQNDLETIVEDELVDIGVGARGRDGENGNYAEEEEDFLPPGQNSDAQSSEAVAWAPDEAEASVENLTEPLNSPINSSLSDIESAIESLVFASPQAISLTKIKTLLKNNGFDNSGASDVIKGLQEVYAERGIQLVKISGGYQFRTHPRNTQVLSKLLEDKPTKLSKSALEVLAIIAYKQPITRAEIDVIRGIDSGHLMRGLLEKNLVRTSGHAETPGRPFLYGTTPYFLEVFSLGSLDDLPSLEDAGRELGNSDTPDMESEADYYDKSSPLAADPDRGDFDQPETEETLLPDFSTDTESDAEKETEANA